MRTPNFEKNKLQIKFILKKKKKIARAILLKIGRGKKEEKMRKEIEEDIKKD